MSTPHFGLQDDPFADAHELTVEEATQLLRQRITAAGGDGTRLFPTETCVELHRLARGRRGGIFALAGRAMRIAARAGAMQIEVTHVQTGASEAGHEAARAAEAGDVPAETRAAEPESGAFMLPTEPSPDLEPDARDWVGRFISGPGNTGRTAAARLAHPPTLHDESPAQPARPKADPPRREPASPAASARPAAPAPAASAPSAVTPPRSAAPKPAPAVAAQPRPAAAEAQPDASPPAGPQLSPETTARLRASRRGRERRQRSVLQWGLGAAAALAIVAVAIHRLPAGQETPPRVPAATSNPAAPAPLPAPEAPPSLSPAAKTGAATVPAQRPAATTAAKRPAPAASAPAAKPAAEAASEAATEKVGLEVATFIFPERAEDERARLAAAGYRARVRTAWENGAASYRVILGPYSSWAAAERAADALLARGAVQQARVVRLD